MSLELGDDFLAHLQTGTTNICRCWKLERVDGQILGFTDHDRQLAFDGMIFEPETGFSRSIIESGLGLGNDNMELAGALSSDAISETDLSRGFYDNAKITQWLVNWQDVSLRVQNFSGQIGSVRYGPSGFVAELVGASSLLDQPIGRVIAKNCDARLGDNRCKAVLGAAYETEAVVVDVLGDSLLSVALAASFDPGWFDLGEATVIDGALAGQKFAIVEMISTSTGEELRIGLPRTSGLVTGDRLALVAGCDRTYATCKAKFANLANFQGFPHLPGEDWANAYPNSGERHDGSSLFK